MAKLNQIIAIEKGIKARNYSEITGIYKLAQKPDLFNGLSRTYQPLNDEAEDAERLPAQSQRVQASVEDMWRNVGRLMSEHFDVTARKDWTNTLARADVKIDDKVLLEKVPVTYLLFLEKQLTDIRTSIDAFPTLDTQSDWTRDSTSGLFKTPTTTTHRTKKVAKPIVLYPATEEHPAQCQMVSEDVIAGHWNQVNYSGAMPIKDKKELLIRINKLIHAVKMAREEANSIEEMPSPKIGDAVFNYLTKEE